MTIFEVLITGGHAVLLCVALGLFLLTLVLVTEAVAARRAPLMSITPDFELKEPFVIVMPAHNEVGTIDRTLPHIIASLPAHGSVLVVADNCTDDTAALARSLGATVIERKDPDRRGKGYAVNFAVRHLTPNPPSFVVILDADCIPDAGALATLLAATHQFKRPVQARYELDEPGIAAGPLARIGTFAWRIKNVLRPTGLVALGVPCLLMGTGMAFPWRTLADADLDTGHLVEDMVLGLQLATRGQGAVFVPEACVRSSIPPSQEGQRSQRTRWETGHLQVIRNHVPRTLMRAAERADWRLLFLGLHAAVPPLALYVLLIVLTTGLAALVALMGGPTLALQVTAILVSSAGLVFATYWYRIGRNLLSVLELLQLPWYLITKISVYGRALQGRRVSWVRSKRD